MNCLLDGCGRPIEHGAAVTIAGRSFHPRCVVRILLADPRGLTMWRAGTLVAQGDLFPMAAR